MFLILRQGMIVLILFLALAWVKFGLKDNALQHFKLFFMLQSEEIRKVESKRLARDVWA